MKREVIYLVAAARFSMIKEPNIGRSQNKRKMKGDFCSRGISLELGRAGFQESLMIDYRESRYDLSQMEKELGLPLLVHLIF